MLCWSYNERDLFLLHCFIVCLYFSFQPVGREDSGVIDNTFGLALVSFASNVEGFCVLTWKVTRLEILCKRGI